MENSLLDVFNAARGYLNDANAEIFSNSFLQTSFNDAYRRLFRCLSNSGSKRIQRVTYVNLPPLTTVLIPQNFGITDMAEPEKLEERPAGGVTNITSTSITTPINCFSPSHGLGSAGNQVEGVVAGVSGTFAPWGKYYATIVDANHFTLNGSMSDGNAGTGGTFTLWTQQRFSEVQGQDLDLQGLDGQPTQYLGVYIWRDEQFNFIGATGTQQLRVTYWASGSPPVNDQTTIGIDDSIDFLACMTASTSARSLGFYDLAERLKADALGPDPGVMGGLLLDFVNLQIRQMQRDPQRRRLPFRDRRSRWGNWIVG